MSLEPGSIAEQAAVLQPRRVAPVVRDQPGEAHAKARVVVARVVLVVWSHLHVPVLPRAPVRGSLLANSRVRVVQQSGVRRREVAVPIRLWHTIAKPFPFLGKQPTDITGDPFDLAPGRVGDADQDHLSDALGMALGVRQPEGHAMREAVHEPPVDAEVLAQSLDVGDEVVRRVDAEVDIGLAGVWRAPAGAPLVEQDDSIGRRVEVPAIPRTAPRPWAAVQDDGGLAVRVPAHLPIQALSVTHVEHPGGVGLDVRIRLTGGVIHTVTLGSFHLIVAIA